MPYIHRKVGDKQCVYKKDGGAKVGCTKGSVDKYLAALHANANESEQIDETNKVKGGLSDKMNPEDIAKKFDLPVSSIHKQITKGIKVEKEHTSDPSIAREIAMDHLSEIPDYYTRLDNMEKTAIAHWSKKEITESKQLVKKILRESFK